MPPSSPNLPRAHDSNHAILCLAPNDSYPPVAALALRDRLPVPARIAATRAPYSLCTPRSTASRCRSGRSGAGAPAMPPHRAFPARPGSGLALTRCSASAVLRPLSLPIGHPSPFLMIILGGIHRRLARSHCSSHRHSGRCLLPVRLQSSQPPPQDPCDHRRRRQGFATSGTVRAGHRPAQRRARPDHPRHALPRACCHGLGRDQSARAAQRW